MSDVEISFVHLKALLAIIIFEIKPGTKPRDVYEHLKKMPRLHKINFQLALQGTGYATANLISDGDLDCETRHSIENLFKGAGNPFGD